MDTDNRQALGRAALSGPVASTYKKRSYGAWIGNDVQRQLGKFRDFMRSMPNERLSRITSLDADLPRVILTDVLSTERETAILLPLSLTEIGGLTISIGTLHERDMLTSRGFDTGTKFVLVIHGNGRGMITFDV